MPRRPSHRPPRHGRGVAWSVACLAVAAAVLGPSCGGGNGGQPDVETSVVLSVRNGAGAPIPAFLELSVYDIHGVVWDQRRLPPSGPLTPASADLLGSIVLYVPDGSTELRIEAHGREGDRVVSQAVTRTAIVAKRQTTAELKLSPGALPDKDGDGVPDSIDVCPDVADPEQEDTLGGGLGDACNPERDGGGDRPADGPGGAGGGGAGGGGAGGGGAGGGGAGGGGAGGGGAGGGGAGGGGAGGGGAGGGGAGGGGAGGGAGGGDGGIDTPADVPSDVVEVPPDLAGDAPRPTGSACTMGGQCASGHCVDGFCCMTSCDGACQNCGRPGLEGSCAFEPAGTICGLAACSGSSSIPAPQCTSGGVCAAASPVPCAPYACDSGVGTCRTGCTMGSHCTSPATCRTDSTCGTKKIKGQVCGADSECESTFCRDGRCCDAACTGLCQSCALPGFEGKCSPTAYKVPDSNGTPTCTGTGIWCDGAGHCNKPDGAPCTVPDECAGAMCVGGGCKSP